MQTILTHMLAQYQTNTLEEKKNAVKEIVQEIALCGLSRAGVLKESDIFTLDTLKTMLNERFDTIDYEQAKQDVLPFIQNPDKLDLWNKDFFISITENLKDYQ